MSASAYTSSALYNFTPGYASIRVFVNGIPGIATTVLINGSAPTITSPAMATPNPAIVLQSVSVSFSVASFSDLNNTMLSYVWNFGDGAQGSGCFPSRTPYTAPGTYHAVVTINNDVGPVTANVDVTVTAAVALIGDGADSDGDGFSDTFEMLAGTDPLVLASTPTGQPGNARQHRCTCHFTEHKSN